MKEELPPKDGIRFLPPFPTVLVGCGAGNKSNLITVALTHVFSFDPPMIGVGIAPERHSFSLIDEKEQFTVNVPNEQMLEEIKGCGSTTGKDVDKFKKFGLSKDQSGKTVIPTVKECPLSFECELEKKIETGDHYWFIGKVLKSWKSKKMDRENSVLYWSGEFRKPGDILE